MHDSESRGESHYAALRLPKRDLTEATMARAAVVHTVAADSSAR
jgi:hypothetical protein